MICVQRLGAHLRLVARSAFGRVAWRRALPQPMMASGSSSELSSLMGRSFRLEAEIGGPGTESETPGGRSRAHKLRRSSRCSSRLDTGAFALQSLCSSERATCSGASHIASAPT